MSKELNKGDFLSFEELFTKIQTEVQGKSFKGQPFDEELASGFRKIYLFLDNILTRAGIKPIIASAAGSQHCADHHESKADTTKILHILET